jgi:hypothetical protein
MKHPEAAEPEIPGFAISLPPIIPSIFTVLFHIVEKHHRFCALRKAGLVEILFGQHLHNGKRETF